MSEFKKISRNSFYSFLSTSFRLFSNVILFWLIAKYYGKEIFGQFTIAQTFATIFVLFADFGLDTLLTTELPRNIKNSIELFKKLFTIKLILSFFAFCGMLIISFYKNFNIQLQYLIIIFSFYALFTTITNFLIALFRGREKFEYEAKISFLTNLSSLIVVLILVFLKENIVVISVAFAAMRFVGLLVTVYFVFLVQPSISFKLDWASSKMIISQVFIFGAFLIFGNLYFQLDTILLTFLKGEESVGIYQAVFRLIMLPLFVPDIIVNSTMPTLSRLNSENFDKWKKLGHFLNKILITISIPISVLVFVHAEYLIDFVYGKQEYAEAVPVLKIFAIIIFVRFIAETSGLVLTTSERQKVRLWIVVGATLINFSLNVFIIPLRGVYGAAIVSLITNAIVAFLYFYNTRYITKKWMEIFIRPQLWLIIFLSGISIWFFNFCNVWYFEILSLILYFLYAYNKIFTDDEKSFLSGFQFLSNRTT